MRRASPPEFPARSIKDESPQGQDLDPPRFTAPGFPAPSFKEETPQDQELGQVLHKDMPCEHLR